MTSTTTRRRMAILALALLLVGVWLALTFWRAAARAAQPIAKGPMVQNVTTTSLTVAWETQGNISTEFNLKDAQTAQFMKGRYVERIRNRRAVECTDLKPGHRYQYRITSNDQTLAEGEVHTAPEKQGQFRLAALGDSGEGNEAQAKIAALMVGAHPDLVIHTGDLVYPAGAREDYVKKFYRPYEELLSTTPFYPCPGNHDYATDSASPMFEEFVLPPNGPSSQSPERFYWFDFGPARFVSLDSNVTQEILGQVVAPWLDLVLAEAGDRWKIVFLHHPAYTHGKYEPTYRLHSTVLPVMESHGVHLLLSGHDHMYQRSHPIRGGLVVGPGQGIVHLTTAGGGAELYEKNPSPTDQFAVVYNAKHSFTLVEVKPEAMRIQQIAIDGTVIDEFTMEPSGGASGAPGPAPWPTPVE